MTIVSRTHHTSHRRERSLSREPTHRNMDQDRSPLEYDCGGSISPPKRPDSHQPLKQIGNSHRPTNRTYNDRPRERPRDRSQDRDWRRYEGNGSRVNNRNRDNAHDDDFNERLSYEQNTRKVDLNSQEWNRQADCYRGRRSQRDHSNHNHYEPYRSNGHEPDSGSVPDRNGRRDYRQLDQPGGLYPKDKYQHSSYDRQDRQSEIRQGDYAGRTRHQNQNYQSSSHLRRHYSPRAPPSPSKSPMRRPFKSQVANKNEDRYLKRRKLDHSVERHAQSRRSSRSRIRRTDFTRSFTPSRSPTPSDCSRSRSRTRSRSKNRAKSRSCSRSNSPDLYYPPAHSPSPIPPSPPRPPKSKLTSRPQASDILSHKPLRSSSPRRSPRHPRRPRSSRRSRTPPEFSASSLDGQPCDVTTRSRSSRRTRSHSRRRSPSPSVISGYSRTPSPRRSRSRSARPSSDRRFSSSSRRQDRSRSRSSTDPEHSSSPRSFHRSRSYRRRREIEDDLGPPPQPPRPPIGPRFTSRENPDDRWARGSVRRSARGSSRQRQYSPPPKPPSPPPRRPRLVKPTASNGALEAPRAYQDIEDDAPIPSTRAAQAPLPPSPPPVIPKPPKSPKRLRSTVQSIRKAPGMPPIAPVAQTSAGVRRFFPGDDDEDEDEAVTAPIEPTKSLIATLHPEQSEVAVELNPKPPSPSPPPLPPPPKSPLRPTQKRNSSHPYRRQHASRRLSQTPPPLPPAVPPPPPPPPPMSPVEVNYSTSTDFIAQDSNYTRRNSSDQTKRKLSPRSQRFTSRWNAHDMPHETHMDLPHSAIIQPDWQTNSQTSPVNNMAHQMVAQPEVSLPVHDLQYGNQIPTNLTCNGMAYQNHYPPPSASHMTNQPFISHQQPLGVPQALNFPADPQITNRRRETKEVYERLVQVGEGTYGKVYKARNVETGELVAMKRIRMEAEKDGFPITAIREIKLLQGLHHPNIVNLVEMVVSKGHVYIVFEYMDHDLSGVLHHPSIHFSEAHTKSLMYQLLSGLKYMHEREVLHRDLKGSNILLNKLGQLKIADFGLARRFERGKEPGREGRGRGRDYTNRVITLWYKPPELLFGATVYGEEVDMWSAGAIFLELFTRRPILQTADEIDQLHATFKLMGTPTQTNWPEAFDLPWFELFKPKVELPSKLRETFFGADKHVKTEAGMCLAEKLLSLRPDDRPSARYALKFPYFSSEKPQMEMPKDLLSNVKGEWHELESKRARKRREI